MDPITTAVVSVLPTLASDLVKSSVTDAYEGLKAVIRRKWGDASPIARAVDALEAEPCSKGQALVLSEKVEAAGAAADPDVAAALASLVSELKRAKIGGKTNGDINVTILGGRIQGVLGAGDVSINELNFGAPPKRSAEPMR